MINLFSFFCIQTVICFVLLLDVIETLRYSLISFREYKQTSIFLFKIIKSYKASNHFSTLTKGRHLIMKEMEISTKLLEVLTDFCIENIFLLLRKKRIITQFS